MSDPYVRRITSVPDMDGRRLDISVDYDCVDIAGFRLGRNQAAEFAAAFFRAVWQAGENARLMAEEAAE